MATVEQRILLLENENKSRKSLHPVVGSLVKYVSQTSQTFSRSSGNYDNIVVSIKFTADNPNSDALSLVSLRPQVSANPDFSTIYPSLFYINEPQKKDGTITMKLSITVPYETNTYYFRAISTGSTKGTFALT